MDLVGISHCEQPSFPKEKVTSRKLHHEQNLLNVFTFPRSTIPKQQTLTPSVLKTHDLEVVKIMWWVLLPDNSSQCELDTPIKSGNNLGQIDENTNLGIFSTVLMYIFSQSWHIPPSPLHHLLCVAPRAINPALKAALSFTTQTTASTCL